MKSRFWHLLKGDQFLAQVTILLFEYLNKDRDLTSQTSHLNLLLLVLEAPKPSNPRKI